jgi:hypothetical protein
MRRLLHGKQEHSAGRSKNSSDGLPGQHAARSRHALVLSGFILDAAVSAVAAVGAIRSSTPGPSAGALVGRPQTGDLHLAGGVSSAHFTITALSPATHTYDVLVATAASADLSVGFETWYGRWLGAQYSTKGTLGSNCKVARGRMACLSHFPELAAERGGSWTVVASKRSGPPVSVRVTVTFHTATAAPENS